MKFSYIKFLICLFLLSPYAAYSQPSTKGVVDTKVIWEQNEIPVCWLYLDPLSAEEFTWVKDAVANTWEAASKVRFVGWGQCAEYSSNGDNGIRIGVGTVGPQVFAFGSALRFHALGMVLNFTFDEWKPSCGSTSESYRQFCIETIAVHEFGHALGFFHEQSRPDTPAGCSQTQEADITGHVIIGDWDIDSVMNYCNPRWNGDGTLSETDILTVQTFYGKPDRNPNTDRSPTARIAKHQTSIPIGSYLNFDGSPSYDPEGYALTYSWRFGDTSSTIITSSPYVEYVFNIEGDFAIFLTVDDGIKSSQPNMSSVTVYDPTKIIIPILSLLLN